MASVNETLKKWLPSAMIGLAAPIVLPALVVGARPLAKTVVKGCLVVAEVAQGVIAEAGEQLSDLVDEAQAERAARNPMRSAPGDEPSTGP